MTIVIADTSPLQYLFQIGHLELLRALYGVVIVAEAVRDELLVGRVQGIDVPDPTDYGWITVRAVTMHPKLEPFELDPGERAALSLAVDVADAVVVLDDGPARSAALALSIPVTGTLGVLLRAKECGLIGSVAGLFELLEKRGFRIGPALLAQALAMAGESDK